MKRPATVPPTPCQWTGGRTTASKCLYGRDRRRTTSKIASSIMNIKTFLLAMMAMCVLAGCQTGGSQETGGNGSSNTEASSSRDEYLAGVREKMKILDNKIADLSEKSKGLSQDARAQADSALAELKQERAVLAKKYDDLSKATQDAWASAKESFGTAWDQMQSSMAAALAKFN